MGQGVEEGTKLLDDMQNNHPSGMWRDPQEK
jgi:hypothetical protein